MATTPAGARLTAGHRAAQLAIRARSLRGLVDLWPIVDVEDLSGTIETFTTAAVLLALQGNGESAMTALDYFEAFRRAEATRAAALRVAPAAPPAATVIGADLRGAALKGIIDGRRAGMSTQQAGRNGLARVAGALTKQVLTGGRMTIITGAAADQRALGWARVTDGDPCTFCRTLASRGAVYKSQKSAEFEAHPGCACLPEIIYSGRQQPGSPALRAEVYQTEYATAQEWARLSGTMSKDTANDAVNNYRRWLANGKPEPGTQVTGEPGE